MVTKRMFSMASATVITLGLSLGQAGARMHHTGNDDAEKTLQEIKALASSVEDQADQLLQISQNQNLSPYSHLTRLDAMKNGVNRMGRDLAVLEAERETLPPWEQEAVDDTLPLLRDAANNIDSAFEYFKENRTHLWTPDYRSYASRIYEDSGEIAKSLKGYLKDNNGREERRQREDESGSVSDK